MLASGQLAGVLFKEDGKAEISENADLKKPAFLFLGSLLLSFVVVVPFFYWSFAYFTAKTAPYWLDVLEFSFTALFLIGAGGLGLLLLVVIMRSFQD